MPRVVEKTVLWSLVVVVVVVQQHPRYARQPATPRQETLTPTPRPQGRTQHPGTSVVFTSNKWKVGIPATACHFARV
ncbi:hypothetical protein E2C01_044573 [Portunus trituberculatus]|uniref:Secreted protein n=1 Tax=Portunus trituberculatus TaxID=210409 RepID=A0A5B7G0E8_PORTR|nr:hypothetical protein [Portunus trituberculatus]